MPPARIVPALADEGVYLASESTFQRVLRAREQASHCGRARPPRKTRPATTHVATAPRQVWSWVMGPSALVEVRPAMWRDLVPEGALTPGQKDAWATASWLQSADRTEALRELLHPQLVAPEKLTAQLEGWILGT